MGNINLWRHIKSVTYAASSQFTIELPRDYFMRKVGIRARLALASSTGLTSAYLKGAVCMGDVISRVELVRNGNDTIRSLPMRAILEQNQMDYGVNEINNTVAAAAIPDLSFTGILDLAMPRTVREFDTFLNTRKCSSLNLIITTAAAPAVGTILFNSASTPSAVGALTGFIDVFTLETSPVSVPADRDFATYKQSRIQVPITATESEHPVTLALGGSYRGFLIEALNAASAPLLEPAAAILNAVTLSQGTYNVIGNWRADTIAGENKHKLALQAAATGRYYLDLCPDGLLSEALDSSVLSSLQMKLDVTVGTVTEINIYPQVIYFPAASALPVAQA